MPSKAELESYAQGQATAYGIPVDYFTRFIQTESSWNPEAVSSKGAEGIVQIVPSMHPEAGDPFDPMHSISWAAAYLRQLYDRFGSWELAFAAYNAGEGAVSKYKGIPPYAETQAYVTKIIGKSADATPALADTGGLSFAPGQSAGFPVGSAASSTFTRVVIWTTAILLGLTAVHYALNR